MSEIVGVVIGIALFFGLILINLRIKNPSPILYGTLRTILAFAAALVGGILPGYFEIDGEILDVGIRASGALAMFTLVFLYAIPKPEEKSGELNRAGDLTQRNQGGSVGGIQNTGSGNIIIGLTPEDHEKHLKDREQSVRRQLESLYKEREAKHTLQSENLSLQVTLAERELAEVRRQMADLESSYVKEVSFLKETIESLRSFKGDISDQILEEAEEALKTGDTSLADKLFAQVEAQEKKSIERAAKASFERGKIAESKIDYYLAFECYQRAVELAPTKPGYLSRVANLARQLAYYDKAIAWDSAALDLYLKEGDLDHPSVAISHNNLGLAWESKGDYDKAIEYYELALESGLKTFDPDHPSVAARQNNLGSAWESKGDYDKAIEYFELALKSGLKVFGSDHPRVATIHNNLGEAWRNKGDYDKAIEYYELALESGLKTFDPDHPSIAIRHNNLGSAWESKGDYDKAIEYYELALESDLKTFGPDHPSVAIRHNNLGEAWYSKGDYDKVIEYFELSLDIFEKRLGPEHPYTKSVKDKLERARRDVPESE